MTPLEQQNLLRTRALLATREAENVRLATELEATGITDFADRVDWLMAFWPADRRLAWDRYWAIWGVTRSAPFQDRVWEATSRPTAARKHRPRTEFTDRQLEIAMAALAATA